MFSLHTLFLKSVPVGSYTLKVPKDLLFAFNDGEYEEKNVVYWLDRIFSSIGKPVTLYDVGANCGYFVLRFSHAARHIYAFEPVRRTYSILTQNIRLNGLKNAAAFKVGLSDVDGEAVIQKYSSSGNNSLFRRTLPPGHPVRRTGKERITTARLDTLFTRHSLIPPDVVKIDTEGAELFVLKGARRVIEVHRPFICMEFADSTYRDAGYSTTDVLEELERLEYEIRGLSSDYNDRKLYSQREFDGLVVSNIIAIPKGSVLK